MLIYISFENLLTKERPEHRQNHLLWWIGCSIGVYNIILLLVSKYSILMSGVIFTVNW